jgi:hypothetical protein
MFGSVRMKNAVTLSVKTKSKLLNSNYKGRQLKNPLNNPGPNLSS